MSGAGERQPRRSLGLLDATMVGMGAMIGAGIFVLTGLAAEVAGPAAVLVFVSTGIVTAFTALSAAERTPPSRPARSTTCRSRRGAWSSRAPRVTTMRTRTPGSRRTRRTLVAAESDVAETVQQLVRV